MQVNTILITGATGFIGQALCQSLSHLPYQLKAVVRKAAKLDSKVNVIVRQLDDTTDWDDLLSGVDVVIHLAGRAHVLNETEANPYDAFAAINVVATRHLVEAAARQQVKRFIYMSSVKVCGELTVDQPFKEQDETKPHDDYAKTKAQAEQLIQSTCEHSAMEYVIIRPPLVYGVGVKANFKRLVALSRSSLPLPLGAIHNQRSLIYIDNLVDFIQVCISHPNAGNQIFFVSDDHDFSTTELVQTMAKAQGNKLLLLPVPMSWLKLALQYYKPDLLNKVLASLQVDISHAKKTLNWKPPVSVKEAIKQTVDA